MRTLTSSKDTFYRDDYERSDQTYRVIELPHKPLLSPSSIEGLFDAKKFKIVAIIAGEKIDKYMLKRIDDAPRTLR